MLPFLAVGFPIAQIMEPGLGAAVSADQESVFFCKASSVSPVTVESSSRPHPRVCVSSDPGRRATSAAA